MTTPIDRVFWRRFAMRVQEPNSLRRHALTFLPRSQNKAGKRPVSRRRAEACDEAGREWKANPRGGEWKSGWDTRRCHAVAASCAISHSAASPRPIQEQRSLEAAVTAHAGSRSNQSLCGDRSSGAVYGSLGLGPRATTHSQATGCSLSCAGGQGDQGCQIAHQHR